MESSRTETALGLRIIVCGGRDFNNYDLLKYNLDGIKTKYGISEIISGGSKGTDALGERYALEYQIQLRVFKADWQNEGKKAGPIRNLKMAKYATACIAFWDGKSKGTKDMIKKAIEFELVKKVVFY